MTELLFLVVGIFSKTITTISIIIVFGIRWISRRTTTNDDDYVSLGLCLGRDRCICVGVIIMIIPYFEQQQQQQQQRWVRIDAR